MSNGIYVALSGNVAIEKNLEVVSNNLANASTSGFKKEKSVFSEYIHKYKQSDIPEKMEEYYTQQDKSFTELSDTYNDHSQGSFRQTDNPLDLAIEGSGFFKVKKGEELFLQRSGEFTVDNEGYITDADGAYLLNENQEPIIVDRNAGVNIREDGMIVQGEDEVGRIALFDVNDTRWLTNKYGTRYTLDENSGVESTAQNSRIHQGYLESSNVNIVAEMTEMIKLQRHYETASKAIKAYQTLDEKAVNKVGVM